MWGPGTAILIVLALGTGLVLLVWAVFAAFPTVTRVVTQAFWCPFRELNVTAEFQEDAWDGRPVAVNRCSAFSPPDAVECGKACLRLDTLPPIRNGIKTA